MKTRLSEETIQEYQTDVSIISALQKEKISTKCSEIIEGVFIGSLKVAVCKDILM